MRISEDRYFRDLRQIQLAIWMLNFEARTRTICTWTGLPKDRVRKLALSTVQPASPVPRARHRGRSPRQTAYFFRSPRVCAHASVLACYFDMAGVVPHAPKVIPAKRFPSVARGELLCETYGFFCLAFPEAVIDFERAILLATALAQREEVGLEPCQKCGGLTIIDCLERDIGSAPLCQVCRDPAVSAPVDPEWPRSLEPMQMCLFEEADGAAYRGADVNSGGAASTAGSERHRVNDSAVGAEPSAQSAIGPIGDESEPDDSE